MRVVDSVVSKNVRRSIQSLPSIERVDRVVFLLVFFFFFSRDLPSANCRAELTERSSPTLVSYAGARDYTTRISDHI